jgi:predicted permease
MSNGPGAIVEFFRSLFLRNRIDAEMGEELQFHLEMETKKNIGKGMSPSEARRQAMIAFGGVERFKERTREERGVRALEDLVADVRFAFRTLRKSPGFATVAVLSLALGIGANTAIFSVVNAMLVRELPYQDPDALVNVYRDRARASFDPLNYPDFLELQESTREIFSELGGYQYVLSQREADQGVETLYGELVTGNYFTLLGIGAALGRTILPEDNLAPGAHPIVVLGHRYWQEAFGSDPGVVGRSIVLSGKSFEVVGVAPAAFSGSLRGFAPDYFAPVMMIGELMPLGGSALESRGWNSFMPVGRLEAGITLPQAKGALSRVSQYLRESYPDVWQTGDSLQAVPTGDVIFNPSTDKGVVAANYFALAVVGLVLLIACSNLASFLLARAVDRRKEVALRLALGARRERLIRQFLTETLVLASLGGLVGLVLARLILDLGMRVRLPIPVTIGLDVSADWTVLGFTVGVSLLTGMVVGLMPALQATRPEVAPTLKDEGAGSDSPGVLSLSRFLVSGQMAVSVVLLVVAGLFIRSFDTSRGMDPGFGQEPTALLSLMIPSQDYSAEEGLALIDSFREEAEASPHIQRVGVISNPHLNTINNMFLDVNVDGVPAPDGRAAHIVDFTSVDQGFFHAAGISLLEGRVFNGGDREGGLPVAIVNEAFARLFWPVESPLGKTIQVEYSDWPHLNVVGVVSTAKIHSLGEDPTPFIYLPYEQEYNAWVSFLAVSRGDPEVAAQELYRMAREGHPDLVVTATTTLDEYIGIVLIVRRLSALLSSVFAVIALGLAVLGLYGVVSHAVARRAREMGIRISLGAEPASVVGLQLKRGMRLVVAGGFAGLLVAALVARGMEGFLFGVSPLDPITFGLVAVALFSVALLAAYLPARRASRISPMEVLKQD